MRTISFCHQRAIMKNQARFLGPPAPPIAECLLELRCYSNSDQALRGRIYLVVSPIGDRGRRQTDGLQICIYHRHRQSHELRSSNLDFSVRPNGAVHQWRKDPPRKLSVGPGS
jgi:hypothetical protein